MNRDEIIRLAVEAGFARTKMHGALERFANLVAAHIRETEFKPDWNNYKQGMADGAAAERERIAKQFDSSFVNVRAGGRDD